MPMNGDSKRVWQHIHDLKSETQELCAKSSKLAAEVAWFCELAEEWARLRLEIARGGIMMLTPVEVQLNKVMSGGAE